jgi:hypothetical protein
MCVFFLLSFSFNMSCLCGQVDIEKPFGRHMCRLKVTNVFLVNLGRACQAQKDHFGVVFGTK